MKKLILLLFIPLISFGQGEQLYADGTANDQDGNTFEWINYGEYDWSIENAEVVTYRDGTPIPQVTDPNEWANLSTGAWNYVNNNPNGGKVYNWYAVIGDNDTDPTTPQKNLAPEGWNIPYVEFYFLRNYLVENGYTYNDLPPSGNQPLIAKSMASNSGWQDNIGIEGAVGNNQSTNNLSGFNAKPFGFIEATGYSTFVSQSAVFWTSINSGEYAENVDIYYDRGYYINYNTEKKKGFSVRFVRDASTASLNDFTNLINIFPNPSSEYINVSVNKELEAVVFDLLGKELIREKITGRLDISSLEKGTYILNLTDGVNTSIHKIIKD